MLTRAKMQSAVNTLNPSPPISNAYCSVSQSTVPSLLIRPSSRQVARILLNSNLGPGQSSPTLPPPPLFLFSPNRLGSASIHGVEGSIVACAGQLEGQDGSYPESRNSRSTWVLRKASSFPCVAMISFDNCSG
ncbi:uncharacterized [Tachysurus ichikawai]